MKDLKEKTEKSEKAVSMNVGLLYRDAANYKTYLTATVDQELKVDDNITMMDLGYSIDDFFEKFIGDYNDEYDHYFLEVTEILSPEAETEIKQKKLS